MNLRGGDMLVYACIAFLATYVESFTSFGVARAIPTPHMALTGTPMTVISGISLAYCFTKCKQWKCSAFNYGEQECELLGVFLCDNTETLIPRSNFTYYDVETDGFVEIMVDFLTEPDCLTLNRCSPKCYLNSASTTTTTTSATPTIPATTASTSTPKTTTSTSTTPTPTTPTSSTPTSTTPTTTTSTSTTPTTTTPTTTTPTTSTPTTTTPTTTTPTTTTPTSTTLTPTVPTTSTTTPPTTAPAGSGLWQSCSTDPDCTTPFSDCRNSVVCECVAGYSFHTSTGACVKPCPGSYGSSYSKTEDWTIPGYDDVLNFPGGRNACEDECNAMPGCVSFEFNNLQIECNLATVSKDDPGTTWAETLFHDYYQRDCA